MRFLVLKFPATGSGWVDLATAGYTGDILIWADVNCCTGPVSEEGTTWGQLKSSFR